MITVNIEGRLVRWYDDVGALFDEGEVIADIQTADGIVRVTAPYSGRLTEMRVLTGEEVQAGQTIGWLDEVDTPQQLGSLIDPPAAERKLKSAGPKRKPQSSMTSMARVVLLVVMMATAGAALLAVLLFVPVRTAEVQVMTAVPVVVTVTAVNPMPVPTARFRIRERVLLRGQVGEHNWGEQGVVQNIGYEPGTGTWYDVQFGDDVLRLSEFQMEDLASIAPTPTMRFDGPGRDWSSTPMMLKEATADFPAGTRVTIGSAMFNGVEYELSVTVEETGTSLRVRESQLEYAP